MNDLPLLLFVLAVGALGGVLFAPVLGQMVYALGHVVYDLAAAG